MGRVPLPILLVVSALAAPAAAQFTPNSAADGPDWNPGDGICEATAPGSGICTLRAAIQELGAQGGQAFRTIDLPGATFPIQRPGAGEDAGASGDLDTMGFLTIQGAGVGATVIDGQDLDRVFDNHGFLLELRDLTIRGGLPPEFGGGAINTGSGMVRLIRCEVIDNQAPRGGGIHVPAGRLYLEDTTVSANHAVDNGGGIDVVFLNSEVEIVRSTIAGNTTEGPGGGITVQGDLAIVNSTISGNAADGLGGGLSSSGGSIDLRNVTITNNTSFAQATVSSVPTGGGIFVGGGSVVQLRNSLIAGNRDGAGAPDDCEGPLVSEGHNLFGASDCAWSGNATGVEEGLDPLLGALADNGGATRTHLPTASSPAIDAGDPAGCLDSDGLALVEDQRGALRPQDGGASGGAVCDVGAVEVLPEPGTSAAALAALLTVLLTRRPSRRSAQS